MAKEAEHEAAQRREVFEIVARKSANSLAALERDGWRLVTPRSQGIAPQFRRRVGRRWEYLPALAELDRTDFATALSVRIFMHCDDALQAWSGGDMERAFAQAFLAGFYVGRSNAIVNESRRNATKRAGKGLGADIAAQYRAAIERAGRNATQHEILAQLPPELYESVATKTHLNRLTSVQKNLSREH
ncbi:MAG: hypothetical protein H3C27_01145 [Opitutaceae bacterium]|nr:hypothetical protein [Opitutaceae bacterium]